MEAERALALMDKKKKRSESQLPLRGVRGGRQAEQEHQGGRTVIQKWKRLKVREKGWGRKVDSHTLSSVYTANPVRRAAALSAEGRPDGSLGTGEEMQWRTPLQARNSAESAGPGSGPGCRRTLRTTPILASTDYLDPLLDSK